MSITYYKTGHEIGTYILKWHKRFINRVNARTRGSMRHQADEIVDEGIVMFFGYYKRYRSRTPYMTAREITEIMYELLKLSILANRKMTTAGHTSRVEYSFNDEYYTKALEGATVVDPIDDTMVDLVTQMDRFYQEHQHKRWCTQRNMAIFYKHYLECWQQKDIGPVFGVTQRTVERVLAKVMRHVKIWKGEIDE